MQMKNKPDVLTKTGGDDKAPAWEYPGGKLIELGATALSDEELVTILIGTGYKNRPAKDIAKELFDNYFSLYGLLGRTDCDLSKIKGLKAGKIARISAAFEVTKRLIKENRWDHLPIRKITLELPDMSDAQVLAVLIGSGTGDESAKTLADELFRVFNSFTGFQGRSMSEAAMISGMGDVKVVRIAAAFEMAARIVRILENEA